MISFDTNLLLYAFNSDCQENGRALEILQQFQDSQEVALCDLVLVELYILLRNPAVLSAPLGAKQAVEVCQAWRSNPRWMVIESAPVMEKVWEFATRQSLGRRQIIDARLALTLRHHGVSTFVLGLNGCGIRSRIEASWEVYPPKKEFLRETRAASEPTS